VSYEAALDGPSWAGVSFLLRARENAQSHTKHPPDTKENLLSVAGVSAKVRDLMAPVLGGENTEKLIASLNRLESIDKFDQLRPLFTA
jgi:hypothetical protein